MKALVICKNPDLFQITYPSLQKYVDKIYVVTYLDVNFNLDKITYIKQPYWINNSEVLNKSVSLLEDDYYVYIREGEKLHVLKDEIVNSNSTIGIFNKNVIGKDLRIAAKKDLVFGNWVGEYISGDSQFNKNYVIKGCEVEDESQMKIVDKWIEAEPNNVTANYYKIMDHFTKKRYSEFVVEAEKLFFLNKFPLENELFVRFYLAQYYFFIKKDWKEGVRNITLALLKKPDMAEFWCLIADFYCKVNKDYKRAKALYKIALNCNDIRDKSDMYFVLTDAYKKHPNKMLDFISNQ